MKLSFSLKILLHIFLIRYKIHIPKRAKQKEPEIGRLFIIPIGISLKGYYVSGRLLFPLFRGL